VVLLFFAWGRGVDRWSIACRGIVNCGRVICGGR